MGTERKNNNRIGKTNGKDKKIKQKQSLQEEQMTIGIDRQEAKEENAENRLLTVTNT